MSLNKSRGKFYTKEESQALKLFELAQAQNQSPSELMTSISLPEIQNEMRLPLLIEIKDHGVHDFLKLILNISAVEFYCFVQKDEMRLENRDMELFKMY